MTPYQIINKLSKESSVKTELQSLLAELLQYQISPAFIPNEISEKNGAFRRNNNAFERKIIMMENMCTLTDWHNYCLEAKVSNCKYSIYAKSNQQQLKCAFSGNDGAGNSRKYAVAQKSI